MWARIRQLLGNPTVQGILLTVVVALAEALVRKLDDPQPGRLEPAESAGPRVREDLRLPPSVGPGAGPTHFLHAEPSPPPAPSRRRPGGTS